MYCVAVIFIIQIQHFCFNTFAGSNTAVGAFNNAIIRMCGERVDGGAGYYIDRNDHMLLGCVRIAFDNVARDYANVAVDVMAM